MNESNFQHILRVLNTNLDGKVKVMFALTSIKGVGRRFSNVACKKAEVDLNKRCALVLPAQHAARGEGWSHSMVAPQHTARCERAGDTLWACRRHRRQSGGCSRHIARSYRIRC